MSAPIPDPVITVTRYSVSCLPPDHCGYRRSIVTIEPRGKNRWTVLCDGWAHDVNGEPSMEPQPSERSAAWLAKHSHDLATATVIAENLARTIARVLLGGA
ncbi:hypothetical protein [Nocardia fluminea]|uniref:hypothetical protein n=1 Tax=Nocardia fluminea TaxID=134984 RepID=UPI0036478455